MEQSESDRTLRLNLVFHLLMYSICVALESAEPPLAEIAKIQPEVLTDSLLEGCLDRVRFAFVKAGGDDKAAKGPEFVTALLAELRKDYET